MNEQQPVDRRQGPSKRREGGRRLTDIATHPEAHISVPAFASYLGLNVKTVMKFIHAGELPAYRFGGTLRIKTSDATAFCARSRLPGTRLLS